MGAAGVRRFRGDDWSFSFTWQTDGAIPIPLDGYTVGAFLIVGSGSPIRLIGPSGGAEIEDVLAGKFIVTVDRSATAKIGQGAGAGVMPSVRIQVFVEDEAGDRVTLGVLPVKVVVP